MFIPHTFKPLADGWSLTAAGGPVPVEIAGALQTGVPAIVPGEAHLDLLAADLITDPFDGDAEAAQQWIGDTSWRYTNTFTWHNGGEQRHDLVAYGLDTVAAIELNGHLVGTTQNMHRTYRFNVGSLLVEGENTLVVTFAAPVPAAIARAEQNGYLPSVNHHEYNQLRKMACSFGWDWGIDVAGAGIWQPIGIESWGGVRISEVRPLVEVLPAGDGDGGDDGAATGVVDTYVTIERVVRQENTSTNLNVTVTAPDGETAVTATATLLPGETSTVVSVKVPNAKLWWPTGYGDQPLYSVVVTAQVAAASEFSQGTATWQGRVGFRTIRVDTTPDADGAPFTIYVNDQRVLIRGINWIPDHAFLTQVTPERYARGIKDAVEAGVNLFRIWGGGIYESDVLYDLADQAGILMWQDFLFACAVYPETAEMKAEVEAEARQNIARLSSHPSLIIWNGNNENTWGMVDWGWAGIVKDGPWGDYYYSELFPKLLAELDPTRFYCSASPYSFGKNRHPNDPRFGTHHQWEVWNRQDYTKYRDLTPRFVSEFGYQGPPAWSTLTKVVHDQPLNPFGPQMLVHQKANLGNQKLARGWQSHLPDPTNVEDWHWTTSLNQGAAIRYGIEHYRSLTPLNTGVVLWQLNDNWPVVSWAAVDHDGHRKPLWYAMRAAYAPRLATLQPRTSPAAAAAAFEGSPAEKDYVALVLVNDTAQDFAGSFTATRQRFDGTILASADLPVQVPARGATTVAVPPEVMAFGNPTAEVVVVAPDQPETGFATAFWDGAEVVDQKLDPNPLEVTTKAVPGGFEVTAQARTYTRDAFLPVDQVDPQATVDQGLVTLPAGGVVTFRVVSLLPDDRAGDFAAKLRTANGLLAPHAAASL